MYFLFIKLKTAYEKRISDWSSDVCSSDLAASSGGAETVKVGVLHSLSGTMAISEVTVKNSTQMAIDEINAAGGVMGKQVEAVTEDGASDPATFAQKATKLIDSDGVVTVFGGWTSSSRKALLPVFEKTKNLLWYPVQFEGNECSPNIMYSGAQPNQQILPAYDWGKEKGFKKYFLVGSDYVFPRPANLILQNQLQNETLTQSGEECQPLGANALPCGTARLKGEKQTAINAK